MNLIRALLIRFVSKHIIFWDKFSSLPFIFTELLLPYVQIVDRDAQGHRFLSREYVQPQWIFDCVNARIILPTESYMVGR